MNPAPLLWPLSLLALIGLLLLIYAWVRRQSGSSAQADLLREQAFRRFSRGEISFAEYREALFAS